VGEIEPVHEPRPALSFIVPVFGDGGDLESLARGISDVCHALGASWELILVNDGSHTPAAWRTIVGLATSGRPICGIDFRRNFGQQNALLAGIRASAGDIIVTMDDDLQHPPSAVPRLLDALRDHDLVYGTSAERVRGWTRNTAALITKAAFASVLGTAHARQITAFRAFRGSLRSAFASHHSPHVSIDVLLSWATSRIGAVPVGFEPRRSGESGYRLSTLLAFAFDMVTGFSVWPLRLASVTGLTFAAVGFLLLVFVLIRYMIAGATVPGFAFLASVVTLFAGAQLFSIGIIGEYLARVYFRTLDKPAYLVASTVNVHPGRGV